jgi:alcohol dehydrogenase
VITVPPSRHGARAPRLIEAGLAEIGGLIDGAARCLLVADPGLHAPGWVGLTVGSLRRAGADVVLWDDVHPDPSEADAERAAAALRATDAEVVVALGGGSAIDTAKAAIMLRALGGRMRDHRGAGAAVGALLPLVVAPSTAGTGSECQSFTLITRDEDHAKMACGHPGLMPSSVLLDADLLGTCPRSVRVTAGLDAWGHALEALVSTASTPAASRAAHAAAVWLWRSLPSFVEGSETRSQRAELLRAAALAGAAIEGGMLGAAHALANPLSARFGLAHGAAVGLMLPHVLAWNMANNHDASERYAALAAELGAGDARALVASTAAWAATWGVPSLSSAGAGPAHLPALAEDALQQWTGRFNPVRLDLGAATSLYAAALAASDVGASKGDRARA